MCFILTPWRNNYQLINYADITSFNTFSFSLNWWNSINSTARVRSSAFNTFGNVVNSKFLAFSKNTV